MIPETEITEVKESADILALVRSYGLRTERRGKDFFTSCPFHEDDTPSLSITPGKNLFHCMGCGEKGNAIQLVQKMENLTFPQAFDKIVAIGGLKPINGTAKSNVTYTEEQLNSVLMASFERMRTTYLKLSTGQAYLKEKRGLAHVTDLEVGFCHRDFGKHLDGEQKEILKHTGLLTDSGKPHFTDCVVFPLKDVEGRVTGLYGRKINESGTHYYLKGERKGVFSIHDGQSDHVYITESVIDALSLNQIGFTSVLALHGVNGFTEVHKKWLAAKEIKVIYLLLDGDKAGREASASLSQQLKNTGFKVHNIELPEGEDPNSFFSLAAKKEKELKLLPGYPVAPKPTNTELRADGEDYVFETGGRIYTIKGLNMMGLDRLRVTIKCTTSKNPDKFCIDSLDLYSARARSIFIEGLSKELKAIPEAVNAEIKNLIVLLEKERLKKKDEGDSTQIKYVMSASEKEEALKSLKQKGLVKNLLKDFEQTGMIGEERAKLLGYLGTISRFQELPLGMLIVSRSGAGKTALQDAICKFVPDESLVKYTRLTGQALFYKAKDGLKNKVLAIEEEEGMEQAIYAIRTLQSSQRLTVATTRTDPKTGKLKSDEYMVEGPVFIMIATTNPEALDYETRNRFIILTIDESRGQTQKIMDARKAGYTLEGRMNAMVRGDVLKKHHNMQRLLRPIEVVNNYAPHLDYPFDKLQMRREFNKYMTLINSIALLHQYQREIKTYSKGGKTFEYIEVTVEDIALANELVLEFFPNSLDDLAPHTRKLAGEITKLIQEKGGEATFTRKELRESSGWSDWPVRQGLEQLSEMGYLLKKGQNGVAFTYELLHDAGSEQREKILLTSADELRKKLKVA